MASQENHMYVNIGSCKMVQVPGFGVTHHSMVYCHLRKKIWYTAVHM